MFETSVIREQTAAAPRRAKVFTASLVLHAVVVLGAAAVSIASVDFPKQAPNQFALFQSVAAVAVPPPLGDPNGGAKPAPKPVAEKPAPAPVPNQVTAPTTVPDDVTPVAATSTGDGPVNDGPPGATSTAPLGQPWGDPNSVSTDLDAPPVINAGPPAEPEQKIYTVSGDVKAPVVIRRVEPRFPPAMAHARMAATIKVRCIIDKQGNVHDPEVLVGSPWPAFNQSVLAAVQQWRFRPASLHGQPVDAWFELTVNFSIK